MNTQTKTKTVFEDTIITETPVNEPAVSEATEWAKAQELNTLVNRSIIELALELYRLRQMYKDDVLFGRKRAEYLPNMDRFVAWKLVNIGKSIYDNTVLKNLTRLNSLSIDALHEFSKASAEVQEEILEKQKSGEKITAKVVKDSVKAKATPPRQEPPKQEPPKFDTQNEAYKAYLRNSRNPFGNEYLETLFPRIGIDLDGGYNTDWRIIEYAIRLKKQQYHPDKGGDAEKFREIMFIEERIKAVFESRRISAEYRASRRKR